MQILPENQRNDAVNNQSRNDRAPPKPAKLCNIPDKHKVRESERDHAEAKIALDDKIRDAAE